MMLSHSPDGASRVAEREPGWAAVVHRGGRHGRPRSENSNILRYHVGNTETAALQVSDQSVGPLAATGAVLIMAGRAPVNGGTTESTLKFKLGGATYVVRRKQPRNMIPKITSRRRSTV